MKITLEINTENIKQLVEQMLAGEIVREYSSMARNAKYGIKEGVDKAVKAYVYSRKDEIIERCVNRASTELIRKGLPKLLERMEAQT